MPEKRSSSVLSLDQRLVFGGESNITKPKLNNQGFFSIFCAAFYMFLTGSTGKPRYVFSASDRHQILCPFYKIDRNGQRLRRNFLPAAVRRGTKKDIAESDVFMRRQGLEP